MSKTEKKDKEQPTQPPAAPPVPPALHVPREKKDPVAGVDYPMPECPGCLSLDSVKEGTTGPGWERRKCQNCGKVYKTPIPA